MVHFLFGGNDVEYIDDECNQDNSHQNVNKAADIRGVASLGQQEPFQFLFQWFTSRIIENAGGKPGWDFLPAFLCGVGCIWNYGAFRLCMIFHDTHFNIVNLPCKSQSCASLGKFCANVVPVGRNELILLEFQIKIFFNEAYIVLF